MLIQFGHNDEKSEDSSRYGDPQVEFPRWLKRYIEVAREHQVTPILITPLARRVFDHGQLLDTHGAYSGAVRDLARSEKIGLIDLTASSMNWLRALGDEASKAYYMHVADQQMHDDTHLQWHGAHAVACLVAEGWRMLDDALSGDLVRDNDCGARASARADLAAQPYPAGVVHSDDVARQQAGPHGDSGTTTAWPYFADAPALPLHFRKRALHKGAGIGLHQHTHDEFYCVLSGQGHYVLDGDVHRVAAGDVLLTRRDSTHAIQQRGEVDLVLLITYPKEVSASARKP